MQGEQFLRSNLLLYPDDPTLPWEKKKETDTRTSVPFGQLKLIIAELEFLTLFWDPEKVKNPILVYAGSAPGQHIPFLSELFPAFEFHLYDPRKFSFDKMKKNITIHENEGTIPIKIKGPGHITVYTGDKDGYFTNEVAKQWSGRNDVFFLSDIRTTDNKSVTERLLKTRGTMSDSDFKIQVDDEVEKGIKRDMRNQEEWYNLINPVKAHLKMRPPYAYSWMISTFRYLDGYILKQPWTHQRSTETRLVPDGNKYTNYNIVQYGDQMYYHNIVLRQQKQYLNPFTSDLKPVDNEELLNDWDSIATTYILSEYLIKMNGTANWQNVVGLYRLIVENINQYLTVKTSLKNKRLKFFHEGYDKNEEPE